MNNTLKLRTIFTLVAALFISIGVQAQTGKTNSKKSSAKTEKSVDKPETTTDKEEVEYYYSYIVVSLIAKDDKINVEMDKSTFESGAKLPPEQMGIVKKAVSGGLSFRSETEFINFMANANYELVTVNNVIDQNTKKSNFYFKIKLER